MTGFASPNHTQTPNDLFDVLLAQIDSLAELKVTLAVIRKTLGYHKKKDPISFTQLQKMTGMNPQAVQSGIEKAILRGTIEIVGQGARGVNIFALVVYDYYENHSSEDVDHYENHSSSTMKIKVTKETTQKKQESKEKEIAATPFVSMKNSIQKAFEWSKPTDSEWGQIQKAASQLLKVDITPDDVPLLYSYCEVQSKGKSFTPIFLTSKASDWKKNRPPRIIPDQPTETRHSEADDGTPATPEQIIQAKAAFAALVASKNGNDKSVKVNHHE